MVDLRDLLTAFCLVDKSVSLMVDWKVLRKAVVLVVWLVVKRGMRKVVSTAVVKAD